MRLSDKHGWRLATRRVLTRCGGAICACPAQAFQARVFRMLAFFPDTLRRSDCAPIVSSKRAAMGDSIKQTLRARLRGDGGHGGTLSATHKRKSTSESGRGREREKTSTKRQRSTKPPTIKSNFKFTSQGDASPTPYDTTMATIIMSQYCVRVCACRAFDVRRRRHIHIRFGGYFIRTGSVRLRTHTIPSAFPLDCLADWSPKTPFGTNGANGN